QADDHDQQDQQVLHRPALVCNMLR
ncbi:MAG: hypothetical protein RJA10_1316, partial [Pseudomonadota bacterium]